MAIKLGNIEPVNFMLGNKQVERICQGEEVVWQRRLIEGVDYQRYEWLRMDGYSFIDTKILPQWGDKLQGTIKYDRAEFIEQLTNPEFANNYNLHIITAKQFNKVEIMLSTGGQQRNKTYQIINNLRYNDNTLHYITLTSPIIKTNGIDIYDASCIILRDRTQYINSITAKCTNNNTNINLSKTYSPGWQMPTILPQVNYMIGNCLSTKGYTYNFQYYKNIEINEIKFYPCKLLRPIVANFASDNKPHPQGECGMLDLVGGKFYGNANTTGSFTVSN